MAGPEKLNKLAAHYSPYKDFNEPKEKPKVTHKVCTKCGRKKPIDQFHKGKGIGGRCSQCKECVHLYYRKHYHTCEAYQQRMKIRTRKWEAEHPDRVYKYRKAYYERRKVVRQRATAELHDSYIIQLLLAQGLTREEITPKIIDIKRDQVAADRQYRKILKVNEEVETNTENDNEDEN